MANINLNPLVSTVDELSLNESSEIIGGNALKTIYKISTFATGVANIGNGILSLATLFPSKKAQPKASTSVIPDSKTLIAFGVQDFFS